MPAELNEWQRQARLDEIRSRLRALDADYATVRMPAEPRREWDRLCSEAVDLGERRVRRGLLHANRLTRDREENNEDPSLVRRFMNTFRYPTTYRGIRESSSPPVSQTIFLSREFHTFTEADFTNAAAASPPTFVRLSNTAQMSAEAFDLYSQVVESTISEGRARRRSRMYERAMQCSPIIPDPGITWTFTTTFTDANSTVLPLRTYEPPSPRELLIKANRARARAMQQRVAQRRANQLLLDNLTEAQADTWRNWQHFDVVSADGRRTYRLHAGITGNVSVIRDEDARTTYRREDGSLRAYCCHVGIADEIPLEDNLLTQKLWLETREQEFLALANPWI